MSNYNNQIVLLLAIVLCSAQLISTSVSNNDAPEMAENDDGIKNNQPDINDMNIPGVNSPLPTPKEVLEMLNSMAGLSDEDKQNLRDDLLKNINYQSQRKNSDTLNNNNIYSQAPLLFGLLGLITFIFGFIGTKLYKGVILKERKLQEKRQMRKLKKKK